MRLLLIPVKLFLKLVYFFMKLAPVKDCVCMLSRESDSVPQDFKLLEAEIKRVSPNTRVEYVCELLPSEGASLIKLLSNTLHCMAVLSHSKACVVDTYCMAVSLLNHRRSLVIVQIWHALGAVKKFGKQALGSEQGRDESGARALNMHKNYSLVTCASQATREIYSEAFGTPPERVKVLGMPRLDYILGTSQGKLDAERELRAKYPQLEGKTVILYAPTFRASQAPELKKMTDLLDFERFAVIVKSHILSNTEHTDSRVIYDDSLIFDLFCVSDYVITDYSAASFEAAAAHKKLLFWCPDIEEYSSGRGLNINPVAEYPRIASQSFADIYATVTADSYPVDELEIFRSKYIQTDDTQSCARIVAQLGIVRETE